MKLLLKNKIYLILVIAAFFTAASYYFINKKNEAKLFGLPENYNVLIVSVCSLRNDRLGVYNPAYKGSPKIDQWAKKSFIFKNAIAELPWQNFRQESLNTIYKQLIIENGFSSADTLVGRNIYRIPPPTRNASPGSVTWHWKNDAIHHYKDDFGLLKEGILHQRSKPFYIYAHLKYMHYPYFDHVNMGQSEWEKLSPTSQRLLSLYRSNPKQYKDKLSLLTIMFNDAAFLKKHFSSSNQVLSSAGVASNVALSAEWKKTRGYKDDLQLVKELYDLKMTKFDDMASSVLNLFGNKTLQKNTIVIFTGDHGEAFMEHGVLGHSVNVYDEMIKYPLIIKFPGSKNTQYINSQVNHSSVALFVRKLLQHKLTTDNWKHEVIKPENDYLMSRSCDGTQRSVRVRSEWKFIKNSRASKNELYDLKNDPGETNNLINKNIDMAWKLEEYLLGHQNKLMRLKLPEIISNVCQVKRL